jgi:hypothetical protein
MRGIRITTAAPERTTLGGPVLTQRIWSFYACALYFVSENRHTAA